MAMTCDICGKKSARIHYINRNYGAKNELLIIENVPVISCSSCRESYLTAETLHEIERIRLHRRSFARKRIISVAEYA